METLRALAPSRAAALGAVRGSCIATTLFMALSGVPDVAAVARAGTTGSKPLLPYLLMLVDNAVGWAFSRLTGDDLSVAFRTLSLVMVAVYLPVMIAHAPDRRAAFNGLLATVATLAAYGAGVVALVPPKGWPDVLGATTTLTAVSFAASPLAGIRRVLKSRDASAIPFGMVSMLTLCAASWATYGALLGNAWMVLPNVMNAAIGASQVVLALALPGPRGASHQPAGAAGARRRGGGGGATPATTTTKEE